MTDKAQTIIPTAACDVVDDSQPIEKKSEPTKLCQFLDHTTAVEAFERTTNYAKDVKGYLISKLGQATFDERHRAGLLSIPEKVDEDRYGNGVHKEAFQAHIAKLLGKTDGLFYLTGVQAQLNALKIYCERAKSPRVAWHVSSHLESAEERAFEHLYFLERTLLGSDPQTLPTVAEIREVLELPDEQRPAAILIELPNRVLGCQTYTFAELEQISSACRKAGVKLHCDGARLWEIEPYYQATADGMTFSNIGHLFDSLYVSFYKGLLGFAGAMLVSNDAAFIREAGVWQRRAGGNAFTLSYNVIECERGYNENIGTFAGKRKKMMEIVDGITEATAKFTSPEHGRIVQFIPEKATCCQIHTMFCGFTGDQLCSARDRVQERQNVRVFERLRPAETVDTMMKSSREAKAKGNEGGDAKGGDDPKMHLMEWMITSSSARIETTVFTAAYVSLCEELVAATAKANAQ